jgi:DNA-binding response OmpR family regulator
MVKKILCVDDSQVVVNFIKKNVESKEVNVISVTSVEDVDSFVLKKDIDLYILDYMMPGMKGDELAKKILDMHSSAKILVYSVMSDEIIKKKFENISVVGFIQKDFYVDELVKKINSILKV